MPITAQKYTIACSLLLTSLLALSVAPAHGTLKVHSAHGPVEWKSAGTQFLPLEASNQVIRVGDHVHTGTGGTLVFELTDGSLMVLSENSALTVQESLITFDTLDVVNLMIRTIRFHVQRLGLGVNPSGIATPTALIAVRG